VKEPPYDGPTSGPPAETASPEAIAQAKADVDAARERMARQGPRSGPPEDAPADPQSVVVEWLHTGCPECHAPLRIDFVVFPLQSGLPTLYPSLLFHYAVAHKDLTPPPAPHPDDEAALDTIIEFGVEADGKTRRRLSYRAAIAEAARGWKPGLR